MENIPMIPLPESIRQFRLPDYETIPDVGLYLEQTTKYITDRLAPLPTLTITNSMIGNYVKRGLIANPVKKQYNRDQIAYLIFIVVAKSVLSLEDIQLLIDLQKNSYDKKTAYQYFCNEFENVLQTVFGLKDTVDAIGMDNTQEKQMLRNTIITVAHKIYLDLCFSAIHAGAGHQDNAT